MQSLDNMLLTWNPLTLEEFSHALSMFDWQPDADDAFDDDDDEDDMETNTLEEDGEADNDDRQDYKQNHPVGTRYRTWYTCTAYDCCPSVCCVCMISDQSVTVWL